MGEILLYGALILLGLTFVAGIAALINYVRDWLSLR